MRLIDADELLKTFKEHCYSEFEIRNLCVTNEHIFTIIDNAPTVNIPNYGGQVVPDMLQSWKYEERPQGEWIDYRAYYKCPFCENWILKADGKPKFCDECGADMRGKEE